MSDNLAPRHPDDPEPTRGTAGTDPLRLALIGWGAISRRVAELLYERGTRVRIVAGGGSPDRPRPPDLPATAEWLADPAELARTAPQIVVEAASRTAVEPWGAAALVCGGTFVPCSMSAFCEEGLLDRLLTLGRAHGSHLVVPPGAVAGAEAIVAASLLPLDDVLHEIVKPPAAWRGTAAETVLDLDRLTGAVRFFEGTAREGARQFPANANAAVTIALAGIGLDRTRLALVADPAVTENQHRVEVRGAFGRLRTTIANRPMTANPKTSEMTALSLVRLIENRIGPLVR